jgi:hypothetical protein
MGRRRRARGALRIWQRGERCGGGVGGAAIGGGGGGDGGGGRGVVGGGGGGVYGCDNGLQLGDPDVAGDDDGDHKQYLQPRFVPVGILYVPPFTSTFK